MNNLIGRWNHLQGEINILFVFHIINAVFMQANINNVMIITREIVVLMKDRTESVLSTDCANKLDTNCVKIRFSSHVKAVNWNSSRGYSQLSHFSVDNMV